MRTHSRMVPTSSSATAGSVGFAMSTYSRRIELGLRNDVYRRPLATALDRLGLREGWTCVDIGAGGGDVSVALAEIVGRDGRIYAVDSDPARRDEVAKAAAEHAQVIAITQAGEDLVLPEPVDLAFCRFLLLHVHDPLVVVRRMRRCGARRRLGRGPGADHIGGAGVGGRPLSMPDARHPDIGALLPKVALDAGLEIVDAWAEAPAGVGGDVGEYLEAMTGVDPGDDPVVLPPLVTVVARRRGA